MDYEQLVKSLALVFLFVGLSIGNGSVAILVARFDSLKTVPNFFLLSSCIGDFLHGLCNLPAFVACYIFRDSTYFMGRPLALALATMHVFLTLVNLFALTLMMLDKLCSFKIPFAYRVWRTKSKAFKVIAVKWVGALAIALALLVPVWDIDLGDAPVYVYRIMLFRKRGAFFAIIAMPLIILNNVIVGITICSAIKNANKINKEQVGPQAQAAMNSRKRNEIYAIKTIGITVMVFLVCYALPVVFSAMTKKGIVSEADDSWFGFISYLVTYIPSLLNPYIYALRTKRFRRALTQLVKDPCGFTEITP